MSQTDVRVEIDGKTYFGRVEVSRGVVTVHTACGSKTAPIGASPVDGRWPGVGLVVTSGRERPGPDDLPEVAAFLTKPYLPATVIDVIRQMATPQVVEPAFRAAS
jgi:two-component system, response regulator PdtaR